MEALEVTLAKAPRRCVLAASAAGPHESSGVGEVVEMFTTPTTIHAPGAGLSLCTPSVISMDTGWDMCVSDDRMLAENAYSRCRPSCLFVRCEEPSTPQRFAQGHCSQDAPTREQAHSLARGILQDQVIQRGGVAVARIFPGATPRATSRRCRA